MASRGNLRGRVRPEVLPCAISKFSSAGSDLLNSIIPADCDFTQTVLYKVKFSNENEGKGPSLPYHNFLTGFAGVRP